MGKSTAPVDEVLPWGQLTALGLQHVLVMYAGAVAVPLIIGGALGLDPHEVSLLIQADLLACGVVTIIQSYGLTKWFGIKLPVMMGVSFAPVGPMIHIAQLGADPHHAATILFGSILSAGLITIIIAPFVSKLLRFFPPIVTGSIIAIIGLSLMEVGINWIFGLPFGPTAPKLVSPENADWLSQVKDVAGSAGSSIPPVPDNLALKPTMKNPEYANMTVIGISAFVLVVIMCLARFFKGFIANIAVLLGLIAGAILATVMGVMHFDKVADADLLGYVLPFHFGMPEFRLVPILTLVLVMLVIMIESTGMFLALSEMCDKPIGQEDVARGLRTDGLGTLIGGIMNTFPYSSFSQNVGLVAVTGVKSRFVCVMGGGIMILLSLVPKLAAVVAALPDAVLGGAGLVMFGMVAATGIRILAGVDYKTKAHNSLIVAVSIGMGMIPSLAPDFAEWMPKAIHPLIESGILLTSFTAVILNLFFNGAPKGEPDHGTGHEADA